MRCSNRPDRELSDTCTSTATHLLVWSRPDPHEPSAPRRQHTEPVCKPCGEEAYRRRPALKARVVPLHVYTPTPPFLITGGHRTVAHHKHGEVCFDCGRTGSARSFLDGLYGCPGRPESVSSRNLPQADIGPDTTYGELASLWWKYTTHDVGMGIGDWRPVQDSDRVVATFTFHDREYVLQRSPNVAYVSAEKLPNRGRPAPELVNAKYQESYKQVVYGFHGMMTDSGSESFATWTPGREDVILYYPEGQIRAVLHLTDLKHPADPLSEVTEAVCDAFGAIIDIKFQQRIYE